MQQDSPELTLQQILGFLRRRLPLIVLCAVLAGAAAFGYSKHKAKKYTSTASLVFNTNSLSQQIAGLPATGGFSSSSSLLAQQANNAELIRGGDTAAKTASVLGHGLTAKAVSSHLSVAGQGESGVVDVSATSASPTLAADIANTYTHQFVTDQQNANHQYFKSALALVHKQLAALSSKQREGPDGLQLQNRAQSLGLLAELDYNNVQVAREALASTIPSSPKTSSDTLLGVFLGLILGLGLALVLERLDRRIRRPEDLQAIYRLPMLGAVPKSAALTHKTAGKRASLPSTEAEAFNLIRAHLRFFNIDRDLRTIMIASPALGDGKSTVALYLAEAAARLGSRVLLLEVDLRQPTLAQRLDTPQGPGLADVLIGALPLGEAIQSVDLDAAPSKQGTRRTLDVLVAGAEPPPNPAELLESHAMDAVLERVKSSYDLVIIDTPPFTAIPDAFPLLTKVDGVVIVGWIGTSKSDAAERLHQTLVASDAPMLGVIANGSKPGVSDIYTSYNDLRASSAVAPISGASSEESVPAVKA